MQLLQIIPTISIIKSIEHCYHITEAYRSRNDDDVILNNNDNISIHHYFYQLQFQSFASNDV